MNYQSGCNFNIKFVFYLLATECEQYPPAADGVDVLKYSLQRVCDEYYHALKVEYKQQGQLQSDHVDLLKAMYLELNQGYLEPIL